MVHQPPSPAFPPEEPDDAPRPDPTFEMLLEEHIPLLRAMVRLHMDPVIQEFESWQEVSISIREEILENQAHFVYYGRAEFRSWLVILIHDKLVYRMRYYFAYKRRPELLKRLRRRPAHKPIQAKLDNSQRFENRIRCCMIMFRSHLKSPIYSGDSDDPAIHDRSFEADLVDSIRRAGLTHKHDFTRQGDRAFRKLFMRIALHKLRDHNLTAHCLLDRRHDDPSHALLSETRAPDRPATYGISRADLRQLFTQLAPYNPHCAHSPAIERFETAYRQLCRLHQRLLRLSCITGMNPRQIANETGYKPSAIRTLLHRARTRLGLLLHPGEQAS